MVEIKEMKTIIASVEQYLFDPIDESWPTWLHHLVCDGSLTSHPNSVSKLHFS